MTSKNVLAQGRDDYGWGHVEPEGQWVMQEQIIGQLTLVRGKLALEIVGM